MGKFKGKRWLAGAMAVMLCCSSFLQTGVFTVSAEAETEVAQEAVQEPMAVEKTEEELIAETVADPSLALEIKQGTAFDVAKDFTGLGLKDGDRAELKKAAMEDGTTFDSGRPGIYKCVYRITPKEGDSYLVARTITVTEKNRKPRLLEIPVLRSLGTAKILTLCLNSQQLLWKFRQKRKKRMQIWQRYQ